LRTTLRPLTAPAIGKAANFSVLGSTASAPAMTQLALSDGAEEYSPIVCSRPGGNLGPRDESQFVEYVFDVRCNRPFGDVQLGRDLSVGQALRHMGGHFVLSSREPGVQPTMRVALALLEVATRPPEA